MKVYIVLCEGRGSFAADTTVEKVFLDEAKAYNFAVEENRKYSSFYHSVTEKEVEE